MPSGSIALSIIAPRLMTPKQAADYCCRPLSRFNQECPVKRITFDNGDVRLDRDDLDGWIDSMKGGSVGQDVERALEGLH